MAIRAIVVGAEPETETTDGAAAGLLEQAQDQATRAGTAEVAATLQELVGQQLTAVIAGVGDPTAVGRWARGEGTPRGEVARRLREAYQVATLLTLAESVQTARAWFMGMNPYLGDRAPAAVFAAEPGGGARVMKAARAFLAHG